MFHRVAVAGVPRLSCCVRSQSTLAPLQASRLRIEKTTSPKPLIPNKELVFGKTFMDHMLTVEYDANNGGWGAPTIQPHGKISLDPSATVFHYGVECFEGMKAYRDKKGTVRMFRPDMNMKRLLRSTQRFCLPEFDTKELFKCIGELCKVDSHWIPKERGYSLYLRPTVIATYTAYSGTTLSGFPRVCIFGVPKGVAASLHSHAPLFVDSVGPYYKTGFAAVSLLADPMNIRAWPGGVGDYKVGGNYAPGILPQLKAAKEGFQQNLWLFPRVNKQDPSRVDHLLTEVGTMNMFILWKSKQSGKLELVTPPLDGTILPGVTRDSILQLTRQWKEFDVTERAVTMQELVEASEDGRIVEMFGSGTAAIVSPIKQIRYVMERKDGVVTKFKDLMIPLDPKDPNGQAGPLTKRLSDTIMAIQYGEVDHPWSVVV